MTESAQPVPGMHPMAPPELPYFIPTATGEDGMFGTAVVLVVLAALAVGTFYLRLHALPERMAHGTNRVQLQIVALLTLIALFTHESIFWIAALLLAAAQLPDFLTPITSGARSLAKMTQREYEGDWEEDEPVKSKPPGQTAPPESPASSPETREG